jgi:hypothetical protein
MAKKAGAKGVIFLIDQKNLGDLNSFDDNSMLVLTASPDKNETLLRENYTVVSIATKTPPPRVSDLELWISALDRKSADLMNFWN